jgi:hypothetical protein
MKNTGICLLSILSVFFICLKPSASAQTSFRQTQADSYTRYELLEPGSQSFRIVYDVSATSAGAIYYFNTLRKGSEHTVSAVYDLMSGQELEWSVVDGAEARRNGHERASLDTDYLQVRLARPVPEGGEARIRIDKTYKDPESYFTEGDRIVFYRTLGIKRNSVVLPPGYELLACNYPSQVQTEEDGRIKVSFMNRGPQGVPYRIEARLLPGAMPEGGLDNDPLPWAKYSPQASGRDKTHARLNYSFAERSFQNREIVYFLQQPETHSFRLYHDYTESRPGVDKYLNVVRAGSKASDPEAFVLDTGEKLKVETLRGSQITDKGIELSSPVTDQTEVVVIWFDPVQEGHSVRLRIWETYTDPRRYLLYNDELVWDRSFGRNRNDVVLPEGWYLAQSDIPGVIDTLEDGRIRLSFVNDRPDNMDVHLIGRRR